MDSNDYHTSTDYKLLLDLLNQGKRIVCFCDYIGNFQDIGIARANHKLYKLSPEKYYDVGARGISYITALDLPELSLTAEDDFIKQCKERNLRFIPHLI